MSGLQLAKTMPVLTIAGLLLGLMIALEPAPVAAETAQVLAPHSSG